MPRQRISNIAVVALLLALAIVLLWRSKQTSPAHGPQEPRPVVAKTDRDAERVTSPARQSTARTAAALAALESLGVECEEGLAQEPGEQRSYQLYLRLNLSQQAQVARGRFDSFPAYLETVVAAALQLGVPVEKLCLSANEDASDISAIGKLADLKSIELVDCSGLKDLSALKPLAKLERLSAGDEDLEDISAVAGLSGLKGLSLSGTKVSDLSSLGKLTGLEELSLINRVPVSDLSPLAACTGLRQLNLGNLENMDLAPLAEMKGLEILWLNGISLEDPGLLANLGKLQNLSLRNTGLTNLSNLPALPELRLLDVAVQAAGAQETLPRYPNLEDLRLNASPLTEDEQMAVQQAYPSAKIHLK